jgi:drug/metabolite transporter (DMT)-like permease
MFKYIFRSIYKNRVGISLIILASLSTAVGQMFWKLSEKFLDFHFIIGFCLYFCGALLMIIAFRFGDLSVLHPLLSFGYVFSLYIGSVFLDETLTTSKILGTLIIFIGATLIGGGDHD